MGISLSEWTFTGLRHFIATPDTENEYPISIPSNEFFHVKYSVESSVDLVIMAENCMAQCYTEWVGIKQVLRLESLKSIFLSVIYVHLRLCTYFCFCIRCCVIIRCNFFFLFIGRARFSPSCESLLRENGRSLRFANNKRTNSVIE